jgi:hypothetical protein
MFNTDMRDYPFYTYGEDNGYGQPTLSTEPQGTIKMAIYTTTQSVQTNINYASASYIGLTKAEVKDTYVLEYEGKKLKVLYVGNKGRFKQAFLGEM